MIDIKFLRENPDIVRENIKKKFQDAKLPLVDEVIELDAEKRATQQKADSLRASRNKLSKQIGALMGQGKKAEAEEVKAQVKAQSDELIAAEAKEKELDEKILKIMMTIPNIIDASVPVGKDDSENVEIERFGEPVVPDFPVPYHTEIMERFNGIDLDAARRVAGNGFYYLMGDIARLHSAVIAYARDFMIDRGFTYVIPPYMIRSDVVTGVMSFAEMDSMMYKIEGEDLYLVGTSEHSMIGKFIDQILPEAELPLTLTSYSPCFRKEKGAHGIEERGVYRIHQFEKQEMIVVCKPEDSMKWYDKLWKNTVDLFRSMDIPVRTLECCSGDLADLKVKSVDVEAWSPRQKKYFEVGSCSNLGDAQARRLGIRTFNTPGANSDAVADYTFGMMLDLARSISVIDRDLKAGQVKKHLGYPVYGRTLGIIGLGAIGKGMARRALGFGMKVMAYDVFWDEAFAKEHGVQRAELEEIYKEADFITLHCGLNEQTRNMIGAEQLRMMKPSAFLINNARGGLVDEAALNEALRSGEIAGAGIDAFVTEPPIGSPLLELEQVIAAPHVAGSSMDSINNMGIFSARNVVKGFAELEEKQA